MRFTIGQQSLSQALNNLVRNTNDKFDAFKNIQIEKVDDNTIKLLADNGTNKLEYTLEARNVEGEPILINAKRMTDIINKLSDIVEFWDDKFICGKTKIKVDYATGTVITPINLEETNSIEIDLKDFKNVVKNRLYAVETKSMGVIKNICINNDEVVATNGNLMSLGKLKNDIKQNMLLSPNLANEIIKDFEDNDKIKMTVRNNKIIIWNNMLKIESFMPEGQYPPYNQIIPMIEKEKCIKINKAEFLKKLDIMSLVVEFVKPTIKLIFKKDKTLTLECKEGQTILNIENYNFEEPFEIFFNVHYLMSILKNTNGEFVNFKYQSAQQACVIEGDDDLTVVMPVQVR